MPHPNESADRSTGTPAVAAIPIQGLTGVFKRLIEQHKTMGVLLRSLQSIKEPSQRQKSWIEARRLLLSHERAEELELYPALEGHDATRHIVERHSQHAEELESAINDLDSVGYHSEDWAPRLRDVVALIEDHVEDEESDFFPQAQKALGEHAADELEERIIGAQREVLNTLP
jgi:hemerythrin superfamily protein